MHNFSPDTLFIGKHFVFLSECHSTNSVADELINGNNYHEGTTIATFNQTNGKGQRGNSWESKKNKNLTFSFILKPAFLPIEKQFYLNIVTSLSTLKFLKKYSESFKVKWPNDIYWQDKKIAGILIENKLKGGIIEACIVGLGINVNQESFQSEKAISLSNILNLHLNLESLLNEVLCNLESYYLRLKGGNYNELLEEYLDNLYWINESRLFKSQNFFRGTILGVDNYGRLEVLLTDGRKQVFDIKEIQFME